MLTFYSGFPGVSFIRLESKTLLEKTLGHLGLAHVRKVRRKGWEDGNKTKSSAIAPDQEPEKWAFPGSARA